MSMVFQQLGELSVRGVGPKKLPNFSRLNLKSSTRNREADGGTRSGSRVDIVLLGLEHSFICSICLYDPPVQLGGEIDPKAWSTNSCSAQ